MLIMVDYYETSMPTVHPPSFFAFTFILPEEFTTAHISTLKLEI
jgi:hypothetical protein